MLWFSGFNAFQLVDSILMYMSSEKNKDSDRKQFSSCINTFTPIHSITNVLFSWSYSLVYEGSSLWMYGFADGKENAAKQLIWPTNDLILQVSGNRRFVVCVTEGGGCWQYSIRSGQWKDLESVLSTEQSDGSPSKITVAKVCCGEMVTAVLTKEGDVYNVPNKLSIAGVKIVDITCGRAHILMLSERGEVFAVGEGSRGQLGSGELEDEEQPRLVDGLAGLSVGAIACGGWHSCAVTADGDLYSWGWNMAGQLGLHTSEASSHVSVQAVPAVVDWPGGKEVRVTKVACGARHTVALLDDGTAWGCGWNEYGQLALPGQKSVGCMTRLAPPSDQSVRDVLCGDWSTALIT